MIKEAGFDAFDFSYYIKLENDEILGDNYRDFALGLKAHMDKIGISCIQAHAPFSIEYGMDKEAYDKKYLNIVRSIESAAILGAKNIVIHSVTTPNMADFEEYNLAFFKSFIPYCEKFGICVAVENLFIRDAKRKRLNSRLGTPKELNAFVEKINSPYIVACVDIGHAALTAATEPEDFIAAVNPEKLACLHVQDNDYLDDRHLIPYSGMFNWEAIMTSLKKIGYCGDLNFEIVKHLQKFPDELIPTALKFARDVGRHLISIYEKA